MGEATELRILEKRRLLQSLGRRADDLTDAQVLRARVQCKDIPDRPIVAVIAANPGGVGMSRWEIAEDPSIAGLIPGGIPERLFLAKLAGLIRRGLVGGCACGCRGDFTMTDKGRALLAAESAPDP